MLSIIHVADFHISSFLKFKDKSLHDLNIKLFKLIIDRIIEEQPDLVLFSGDLFEKPLPAKLDDIKSVMEGLIKLRESRIPFYAIPGSHDMLPDGSSYLEILESANLLKMPKYTIKGRILEIKPIVDEKLNVAVYGIPGFKRNLEQKYILERRIKFTEVDRAKGKSIILMVHTSLNLEGIPQRYIKQSIPKPSITSIVPPGLNVNYYALGHVHRPYPITLKNVNIAYPGAPLGRDWNDIYETLELTKVYGRGRGFRKVKIDSERTISEFVDFIDEPVVKELNIEFKSSRSIDSYIRDILGEMRDYSSDKVYAIVINVKTPIGEVNKVAHIEHELQRKVKSLGNIAFHIKIESEGVSLDEERIIALISDFKEINARSIEEEVLRKVLGEEANIAMRILDELPYGITHTKREFIECASSKIFQILAEEFGLKEEEEKKNSIIVEEKPRRGGKVGTITEWLT